MKKILFSAYSLDVGGIEKALVILLNKLQQKDYDITLALEKKEGIFLNELNPKIKIITYTPSNDKNVIMRKLKNFTKRVRFLMKYKNKFDFSASFATYSNSSAFVAREASKNQYLWAHADYLTLFESDIDKMKKFFEEKKYNKFKKIVFVSKEGKDTFLSVFPGAEKKVEVCNNLIDGKKINELAQESIDVKKEEIFTFVNIGRHQECQKRLTRIIESARILKERGLNFRILFVGDGEDTQLYKNMTKKYELEEQIRFLGRKQNPYPYFKIADCVILTSDYEGYPVVFLESMVLNKPLITTKVSDYDEIEGKYGYVTEKDVKDIADKMQKIIKQGYEIKEKFDYKKYNEKIMKKIEDMF